MPGIYVPGRGPLNARLVVLGEAPGRQEEAQRRPFVGASGQLQEGYMQRVGINPHDVRYENVYPFLPPGRGGNITAIAKEELVIWQEDCLARLDALSSVQLIVPVGNTALHCLTGMQAISLRRGSMYQWKNIHGREVKIIPTIHPATILRDTTLEYRTVRDWERIARELERGSEVIYPERKFMLDPPAEKVWEWFGVNSTHEYLTIDIETNPKAKKLLCVGFSLSADLGIALSWTAKNREIIAQLCGCEKAKVLWNGLYDLYWLRMHNIEVRNYHYDGMGIHHMLRPNDRHSLAYVTSLETDEPYYKGGDDEDDEKEWAREKIDWYALLEYCARDNMVEYEVTMEKLWKQVIERGLEDRYFERYVALYEPLLDMMTHGIRVDTKLMEEQYAQYIREALDCKSAAEGLIGRPLFTITGKARQAVYKRMCGEALTEGDEKALLRLRTPLPEVEEDILEKGISGKVLMEVVYKEWRMTPYKKDGKVTVNEHALRQMLAKVEKRGEAKKVEFLKQVLRYRFVKKLSEFYHPSRVDGDGRMRCEYTYNTRPSRLASRKNPMGGGANLQNQSRKVKSMFLPDADCILAEVDLSQIQARFVYAMAYKVSGDARLLELATNKPWITNIHKLNCVDMFHTVYEEVTDEQYYKGKVTEHSCVDDQTEVLTQEGWRSIEHAQEERNPIAVWNPADKSIWFEEPLRWYKGPYAGDMLLFDGEGINQCVTPDHKMVYWTNGRMVIKQAQDLPSSARIPTAGIFKEANEIITDACLRLNVATQADGCVEYRKNYEYIRFRFKKQRKIERLRSLLEEAEIPYTLVRYRNEVTCITVKGTRASWMTQLLEKGGQKWSQAVLGLSQRSMEILLDELQYWDGWQSKNVLWYFSKYQENMDWIKTLAHLCNKRVTISETEHGQLRGSLSGRMYSRKYTKTKIVYRGYVYCPTVSTGFFLIRRHGEISVTGNTNFGLQAAHLQEIFLKGEEGIHVSIQECEELIRRKFAAKPGILQWQQRIREEILSTGKLRNAWEDEIDLSYERPGEDLWRKGYAWKPQSDEARHMNLLGLIPAWRYLKEKGYKSKLNMQVHDALLFSLRPEEAYDVLKYTVESLEQPRDYYGVELVIPCSIKIGQTWKGDHEWKKLPEREEFERKMEEVLCLKKNTGVKNIRRILREM